MNTTLLYCRLAFGANMSIKGKPAVFVALVLLLLLINVNVAYANLSDDLFGMSYDTSDGNRPSLLPSGTQGLQFTFSASTTGVTLAGYMTGACTGISGAGWVNSLDTVLTGGYNGGYVLQGGVELVMDSQGNYQWYIEWADFNWTGQFDCGSVDHFSASAYPTISGSESIYYSSSTYDWIFKVIVSQNGNIYTYHFPAFIGTNVSSAHDDWTSVETGPSQVGVTVGGNFEWHVASPQFLVNGAWQTWNQQGSNWKRLDVYEVYWPLITPSPIGTLPLSTPGVKIYKGSAYSPNDTDILWCIYGNCPLRPSP